MTDGRADMASDRPAAYRAGRTVLLMVGHLHRLGYQRLRISPGMSSSGAHWRCVVTPVTNISETHGARMVDFMTDRLLARYTSAAGTRYFDWPDARRASPEQLAELFLERFTDLAEAGRGPDWSYAGWYIEMLNRTEPATFPIAYADWALPSESLMTVGMRTMSIPLPPPGANAETSSMSAPIIDDDPLTLAPGRWYAMDVFDVGATAHPRPSPILVLAAQRLKTGRSHLQLDFFHANNPEGDQDKSYRLRVLHRSGGLFIGERVAVSSDHRVLTITSLDREWMERRMPSWAVPDTEELDIWLRARFPKAHK